MLVNTFLVLGCLAFLLIIAAFIPLKIRLTIMVWCAIFFAAIGSTSAQIATVAASAIASVYCWSLYRFGTYPERQAAKRAARERDELVEAIRRDQYALPPISKR